MGNVSEELAFYNQIKDAKKLDGDGDICLKMLIAHLESNLNNVNTAREHLDPVKQMVNEGKVSESGVFSRYYRALAAFHKATANYAEFYKAALLFLAYTDLEEVTIEDRMVLSRDIALASLVCDTIFDFAEFLKSPLVKHLQNSEFAWMLQMVIEMNHGNVREFQALTSLNQKQIEKIPDFSKNVVKVTQKVIYLCVLNMILALNPHDRNVTFQQISEVCLLPVDKVGYSYY
jgi:26S proteasome regulatory subunit N9